MKYNVHIFTVVRVKVTDVEAESQAEAMKKAEEQIDFNAMFKDITNVETEWGEEHSHVLVDEVNDEEYENSKWYNGDLKTSMRRTK